MSGFDPIGGAPIGGEGAGAGPSVTLGGSNSTQQNISPAGIIGIIPVIYLEGTSDTQVNLGSSNGIIVDGIISMDYTEIVGLAKDYSDRKQDPEIVAATDSFLRIVEAKINRKLAVQKAITTKNIKLYADQDYYDLPIDYLSASDIYFKSLVDTSQRATLEYKSPAEMNTMIRNGDKREFYTIVGNSIRISPVPSAEFASQYVLCMDHYLRISPLSAVNPSNYISVFNIDCYLFGVMAEINAFVKDYDAFALWTGRFDKALDEIDIQNAKSVISEGPLTMRVA